MNGMIRWRYRVESNFVFDKFSATTSVRLLTFEAVRLATALDWQEVDLTEKAMIPDDPGVYAWVDAAAPHTLRYHGSGTGARGLKQRLGNQLRWRANQIERLAKAPLELSQQEAFDTAREVPAVQQAAGSARLFIAIARPASWSIDRNEILPPSSAYEWESFISALSLLVAGNRSLIGGGAWESKDGTLDQLMTDLAWDRLVDIHGGTWA